LVEIGKLFDVPLAGLGSVDGTVSGNRTALQASGNLTGDGLTYQDNGALTLTSSFSAVVPDLDFKRASFDADSNATLVKVAGQEINEISGKTNYADTRLDFDLTAKQPQRAAHGTGSVILHPDHQEVHIEKLALTTANQEWDLAANTPATINYALDTVTLDNVHLVSGDQEIVADGRLGQAGSSIQVKMRNVDLARADELLLRPPQFTGRLNGDATIEGTRERPVVSGEFHVAPGGFRQFTYESFGGTVHYESSGATIDARLQQNADQWITAKGYLPATMFAAQKAGAADHIDVTVDSSPLSLGILQGLTNEITNVQGTLEAHVRVTGSADDPHPSGAITLAKGALTVAATGVAYSNIDGRVDLQPDRVHIDQITVLDNHNSALSLTGDLAVHAREVGDFHLWINADDFKLVDNKLGNLRVQGALELGGELRAPELRGDFGVSSGRLDLDEIMAQIPSAYSTEPIADANSATPQSVPEPKQRSLLDGLRMNVRITVPEDLIVTSAGIEVPGALVDLGALNITLGGDLTAIKAPSGAIRLTGAVNTVRGTYDFQGRRFEVLRDGGIHFEGLEEFDPRLDVRTHRLIQGVDARVNVEGTLTDPRIVLSSNPPLEDADILALVVFNQPLNELGAGTQSTLVARAQSLATGAVVGTLSTSIAKALNLETFQFDIAPESGSGPSLTVGQQVGPNLYVKVQQGVSDLSTTNLLLEYAFTNWLRLQTNVQQGSAAQQSLFQRNQGTGADLIFLFSK
jgi:translocation and assembly module TamB